MSFTLEVSKQYVTIKWKPRHSFYKKVRKNAIWYKGVQHGMDHFLKYLYLNFPCLSIKHVANFVPNRLFCNYLSVPFTSEPVVFLRRQRWNRKKTGEIVVVGDKILAELLGHVTCTKWTGYVLTEFALMLVVVLFVWIWIAFMKKQKIYKLTLKPALLFMHLSHNSKHHRIVHVLCEALFYETYEVALSALHGRYVTWTKICQVLSS